MIALLRPWILIVLMLPMVLTPNGLTLDWCSCEGISTECCVSEVEPQLDACCGDCEEPAEEPDRSEYAPTGDCSCCHSLIVDSVNKLTLPQAPTVPMDLHFAVEMDRSIVSLVDMRPVGLLAQRPPVVVRPPGLRRGVAPLRI